MLQPKLHKKIWISVVLIVVIHPNWWLFLALVWVNSIDLLFLTRCSSGMSAVVPLGLEAHRITNANLALLVVRGYLKCLVTNCNYFKLAKASINLRSVFKRGCQWIIRLIVAWYAHLCSMEILTLWTLFHMKLANWNVSL